MTKSGGFRATGFFMSVQHATIHRRCLPNDMVLWLVVGMVFFYNELIAEVARRLNICADGLANEELLAQPFLDSLPDDSVTLLDKGCYGANLLMNITRGGSNRH